MKKLNICLILSSMLFAACGEKDEVAPVRFGGGSNSGDAAADEIDPFLKGNQVSDEYVSDLLMRELEGTPPTVQDGPVSVSLISSATQLSKTDDIHNFMICGQDMILPAVEIDEEELLESIQYAQDLAAGAGIDLQITQGDSGSGIAIFLTTSDASKNCDSNPYGVVGFDPYDLMSEDRAIIFADNIPDEKTFGEVIANAVSMMTGFSSNLDSNLIELPFDQSPYGGSSFGTQSISALNTALKKMGPNDVADIRALQGQITQVFSPGLGGLPGIDKIITLVTLAGSTPQSGGQVDTASAMTNLKDAFVDNSGTLSTLATLAGHPELAIGISFITTLFGKNPVATTPAGDSQPETAQLPDLSQFMKIDATSIQELLLDYRSTYNFIGSNYSGENATALQSLLKLAVAQKANVLVSSP
jgi:hypothetical protein